MDGEPHKFLGVNKNATEDEIREAYREKVKQHHPDVSDREDAAEVVKRLTEARDMLLSDNSGDDARRHRPTEDGNESGSQESWTESRTETDEEDASRRRGRHQRQEGGGGPGARHRASDDDRHAGEDTERARIERAEGIIDLDPVWSLYRLDGTPNRPRWAVATAGKPPNDYLTSSGTRSSSEHWFGSRNEAEEAYVRHTDRTSHAGGQGQRERSQEDDGAGGVGRRQGRSWSSYGSRQKESVSRAPISFMGVVLDVPREAAKRAADHTRGATVSFVRGPLTLLVLMLLTPVLLFVKLLPRTVVVGVAVGLVCSLVLSMAVFGGLTGPYHALVAVVNGSGRILGVSLWTVPTAVAVVSLWRLGV